MTISIEPIKPEIGGIVHVDKADLLTDDTIAVLGAALEDRGVLIFPRIALTDLAGSGFLLQVHAGATPLMLGCLLMAWPRDRRCRTCPA